MIQLISVSLLSDPFAGPPPLLPNQMSAQLSRESPIVFKNSGTPATEQMAKVWSCKFLYIFGHLNN